MGLLESLINWLASFFIPKTPPPAPRSAIQPGAGSVPAIYPAKPAVDVTVPANQLQVGGAWGTNPVVQTPANEAATTGVVTSSSPVVLTQTMVNVSTPERMATYFGFDLKNVKSIATDGKNINVLFNDGTTKVYINPNSAPVNVTWTNTAGQTVTTPPASATNPQTNVAQPVSATNPPPKVEWATDANRINLGGTSLNMDSYYYQNGITNQYGTFYTGYGMGTLPMNALPRGTTIGGKLAPCTANADLVQATSPPPAPPAPPVVTPPAPPAPAVANPYQGQDCEVMALKAGPKGSSAYNNEIAKCRQNGGWN